MFIAVISVSCQQEIDLSKYYDKPVPVINSIFSPDTVVMASISHTVFFNEHRNSELTIKDAYVNLYINSNFIERMIFNPESKMYMSHYIPQENDTVRITALTSLGYAEGSDVVPKLIPIKSLKCDYAIYDNPFSSNLEVCITFNITFSDPAHMNNFYCVRVENLRYKEGQRIDYSYDEIFISQHPEIDFSFNEKGIYSNEGMTFTDAIFDGSDYTMKLVMTQMPPYKGLIEYYPRYFRIMLYSLSQSYYNYLTGILNNAEPNISTSIVDWGLAEPSPHFTNIEGGTGIAGGVQCSYVYVDVLPELQDLMNKID